MSYLCYLCLFGSSLPPVFVGGLMSYLRYLHFIMFPSQPVFTLAIYLMEKQHIPICSLWFDPTLA
jgi:hypothetical protein